MPTVLAAGTNVWDAAVGAFTFLGVLVNALLLFRNGRRLRGPSGDSLGNIAERTHDMAAVTLARVTKQNGGGAGGRGDAT